MKLITAIIKPHKLDEVKEALQAAGVQGMTDHRGRRASAARAARPRCTGAPSTRRLRARRRSSRSLSTSSRTPTDVADVIVDAARTGKIGDGKVWITEVDRVLRIRTGEMDDSTRS